MGIQLPLSNITPTVYDYTPVNFITTNDSDCSVCLVPSDITKVAAGWTQHIHEEWSVPWIESPFNGPLGNSDFNLWITVGATNNSARWGTPIWSDFNESGSVYVTYKSQRLGIDPSKNVAYVATLSVSVPIESYRQVSNDNSIPLPCKFTYDEFSYYAEFGLNPDVSKGYAQYPSIFKIYADSVGLENTCYLPTSLNKDFGNFCVQPTITFITPTARALYDASQVKDSYYTEWTTNYIQEYRKRLSESDTNSRKYFFAYDTKQVHGSSGTIERPDPKDCNIIETDWRRYQDCVGLGGCGPTLESTCGVSENWSFGQVAFGNPDRAIIVGGFKHDVGGSLIKKGPLGRDWRNEVSSRVTYKWNKSVISPEDSFNKNYGNRTVCPKFAFGESTHAPITFGYLLFDVGQDVLEEFSGSVEFIDTNKAEVKFDKKLSDHYKLKDQYAVILTPSANIKCWWSDKSETGFTINVEADTWNGVIDWSILYVEDLNREYVENVISNDQVNYNVFKKQEEQDG